MKSLRNVYYFCTVKCREPFSHPNIYRYCNEIQCIRLYDDDPRIAEYEKKYYKLGHIVKIDYKSPLSPKKEDIQWEQNNIWKSYYDYRKYHDFITIINDNEEMK